MHVHYSYANGIYVCLTTYLNLSPYYSYVHTCVYAHIHTFQVLSVLDKAAAASERGDDMEEAKVFSLVNPLVIMLLRVSEWFRVYMCEGDSARVLY